MATLSPLVLEDIRADIGDSGTAFTDPEIQRIYDSFTAAPSEHVRLMAVKARMIERLLNGSVKLHDYSAGAVDEKLSQIFDQLAERFKYYEPYLDVAMGRPSQIKIGKLGKRQHPDRIEPDTEEWPTDGWPRSSRQRRYYG